MFKRSFVGFAFMLAMWLVGCAAASQPTDPAAVMDAYTVAINAGDVEKALSFVADDAVYNRPAGQFKGKAEIRKFVQDLITRKSRVELVGERKVQGERVTWVSRVTQMDPQNPSAPPTTIMNNSESIVRNGKIVTHTANRAP
jgi:hypothetical protein